MKENKYDDPVFFEKYSQMERSQKGLSGAGEWETLKNMLPEFRGKRVLDLGCGYGWHCRYAAEHGAKAVVGIDLSNKMLEIARQKNAAKSIEYRCMPIEDVDFPVGSFDIVISSLTFHYLQSFDAIAKKVSGFLSPGGAFLFSAEHPVFTAQGTQDWYYDKDGTILHFPVDHYFEEGMRHANFLGECVVKYHRTLTAYFNGLWENGFDLVGFEEPKPPAHLLDTVEGMRDELRRPMMMILSARKRE